MDLDIDDGGILYVSELGGDRVQLFTPEGELLRELRGDDTPAGSFDGAAGVLVAPNGDVYVADFYHHHVVRFGQDGSFRNLIGVPGRLLPGRLHYPTDLDWSEGRLVVADAYNHRIQLFTPDGEPLIRFGGLLGSGLPGSGLGSFRVASGVATDGAGRIYVADFENHRIQVFGAKGELRSVFGSQGKGPGEFERPTDLDIGPAGRIFVVDFGNDRVQVFEPFQDARR
jgi:DNA-binding beta-propeller fold protein YncE